MSVAYSSYKRSQPMSESEARIIQKATQLFGYRPDAYHYKGQWFLAVRGDGADDATIERVLKGLREL